MFPVGGFGSAPFKEITDEEAPMWAHLVRRGAIHLHWFFVLLLVCAPIHAALAANITIDFNGISGGDWSPFASYSESGFTVSANTGNWLVDLDYGNPLPMIAFTTETTETFAVTRNGAEFSFNTIDLYSSVSQIPYTFTGFLNGSEVFTVSGTAPNTFGGFYTVQNPYASLEVDSLRVSLTNPTNPNPIGADNIVVETVPEPANLVLLTSGVVSLGLRRFAGYRTGSRKNNNRS
jgi:hypothetical protein